MIFFLMIPTIIYLLIIPVRVNAEVWSDCVPMAKGGRVRVHVG